MLSLHIYVLCIYIYIYIYIFNSSISLGAFVRRFDLSCADEPAKNETAALHRMSYVRFIKNKKQ